VACKGRSFEICEVLVEEGADFEVLRYDGASALALSVLSSSWQFVELCLRRRSTGLATSHPAPFVVASHVRQLASLYLLPFCMHTWEGVSPRALVGEIRAMLLLLEANTNDLLHQANTYYVLLETKTYDSDKTIPLI